MKTTGLALGVALSPDGSHLAFLYEDPTRWCGMIAARPRLLSLKTGQTTDGTMRFNTFGSGGGYGICWSPDGKRFAVSRPCFDDRGNENGGGAVFDPETMEGRRFQGDFQGWVSPEHLLIGEDWKKASASTRRMGIHDLEGRLVHELPNARFLSCVTNSRFIVAWKQGRSDTRKFELWDLTGKKLADLPSGRAELLLALWKYGVEEGKCVPSAFPTTRATTRPPSDSIRTILLAAAIGLAIGIVSLVVWLLLRRRSERTANQ